MTTDYARRIADEISGGLFGAGASETLRLGNLAVQVITALADRLDAVDPPTDDAPEDAPKPRKKKA